MGFIRFIFASVFTEIYVRKLRFHFKKVMILFCKPLITVCTINHMLESIDLYKILQMNAKFSGAIQHHLAPISLHDYFS